jgi:23S rRNA pseudouridine2605 synthase
MRLQKLLASAGHGSRRAIEEWVRAGRVTVNGRAAQLGDRAAPTDDIRLDGRRLELAIAPAAADVQVLIYHKPVGEVTTRRDPQGRPTVFARIPSPAQGRWINVGRLDVNTSGLLLFTTDGELAHRLMHPATQIEREYLVRLRGRAPPEALAALRSGVQLEDGPARFEALTPVRAQPSAQARHDWYRVLLREGRKREVRRLWSAVGCEVSRLMRVRYGPAELPRDLAPGSFRLAPAALVRQLSAAAAVPATR